MLMNQKAAIREGSARFDREHFVRQEQGMLIDTMDTSNLGNLTDRLPISPVAALVGYHQL
jgi:hypothetical protein